MCGVVGIIGTPDAARESFLGLTTLQHRGQDAAGILTYDQDGFHRVKDLGLVESVFTRENMRQLTGSLALGHARYSTIGRGGDTGDVQPFVLSFPFGIGMVHNGNLVNVKSLKEELKKSRRHLLTQSDTEILLNLFAEGLAGASGGARSGGADAPAASGDLDFDQICRSVSHIHEKVNGSYSVVTLIAGHGLVAFRDPDGIRPLIWGKRRERREKRNDVAAPDVSPGDMGTNAGVTTGTLLSGEAHMIASESVALSFLGYEVVRNIAPGEVIFIDLKGEVHARVLVRAQARASAPTHRPCMFEWVYFASPESVMDEVPVYGARINLGKSLARLIQKRIDAGEIAPDIIVPVPETSRIAAIALAEELKIPYREVLIKNRYIKRTFILDSQEKRQSAVNLKLSPVRSEIEGKRVLLVDDSIVRGTTSKKIVELVRRAGASKVYFVSTCPPIQHPCFYGIDFPEERELIGSGRGVKEIEQALGADAVIYQDLAGLSESITAARLRAGTAAEPALRPCMACLDGRYPTDVSAGRQLADARAKARGAAAP